MADIFQQLQMLNTVKTDTVLQHRQVLNKLVEWFKARPEYMEQLEMFASENIRNLNKQVLIECDSFMCIDSMLYTDIPEEFRHDSYGFVRGMEIVYLGRYVYPVKDVHGDVMGFCGYDKFSDIKYKDSVNYGYIATRYSCWGMEMLPTYYRSNDVVFFVEGIVCALYLRQCGLQALAMLGSNVTPYMREVIKRFGSRAIFICDSDEAGNACKRSLLRSMPWLRVVQSKIAKDVDDSRSVDPNYANELKKLSNPFYRSNLFR